MEVGRLYGKVEIAVKYWLPHEREARKFAKKAERDPRWLECVEVKAYPENG